MRTLLQDARYALRVLAKEPGFTVVAVLTLALAIGANTTVFAVLRGVLFKPLPYPDSQRLVRLYETFPPDGTGSVSAANLRDWQAQSRTFEALSAYSYIDPSLNDATAPERLHAIAASGNLFHLIGAAPALGRTFAPGEDGRGSPAVAVLSDGLWRRLGGDRDVVGKQIKLDGAPATVIGVMPPSFEFPPGYASDAWIPLQLPVTNYAARDVRDLSVIGRLGPGQNLSAAQAEMQRISAGLRRLYPKEQAGRGALIRPLGDVLTGDVRPALWRMAGAVALVLLIACANVGNLLLARAAVRRREIAMRVALGANRRRVIRQLLTESVVLALIGGAAGIFLALAGVRGVAHLAASVLPRVRAIDIDGGVLLFLLCVCVATGVIFGLAPAWSASRTNLNDPLRESGAGSTGIRQRPVELLLVAEFALTLVLLIGAGLLMKSFLLLTSTQPGFVAQGVLTAHVSLPVQKYPGGAAWTSFYRPALERADQLPGVEAAGFISKLPVQEWGTNGKFEILGQPPADPEREPRAELRLISPGYFRALGIRRTRGREIADSDGASAPPVMMVNEELARRYFNGADPVGHTIRALRDWRIVGVVASVRQAGLDEPPRPEIYVPISQIPEAAWISNMVFVVKGRNPSGLANALRSVVQSVAPGQPIFEVQTMEQVISESLADRRLYLWLAAVFGAIALALAAAGMYGVMSYFIAHRTREFGVRLAIGATRTQILRMVIGQALGIAGVGVALGLAAAVLLMRLLIALLYGVKPIDLAVFAAIALAMLLIAATSAWLPAWRATRVDPAQALRQG